MAPRLLLLVLLLVFGLAACGSGDEEEPAPEPTATAAGASEEAGCEAVEAPEPKSAADVERPELRIDDARTYTARVDTSCGEFAIELDDDRAPKTSASFIALARDGFFDDTTFHRVARGFVIQGGDPQGDGTGGPGYSVVEAPPSDLQYTRGVVAMAKTLDEKPGTSGSQFFVVTGEDAALPPDYALLGTVTEGMEVVDRISVVDTEPADDGAPVDPIVIESITIEAS